MIDIVILCLLTSTVQSAVIDVLFVVRPKVILIVINYFMFCGNYN